MKIFLAGLILGIVIGALATVGVLVMIAGRADRPFKLALPEEPAQSEGQLASFLDQHTFEVGFFAKNLATGKTVERFADRSVCLASIVKIFCLTELYRRKYETGLELTHIIDVPERGPMSLSRAADLMIGQGNNAATNALAEFLGYDKVNSIPARLGLDSMSPEILPADGVLRRTLERRIFGERVAPPGLPQHGTAAGVAEFFERLINGQVISQEVSAAVVDFLSDHPKPFSLHYAGKYDFAGKGGNILWVRPSKHYAMMVWGLFVRNSSGDCIVLCVWGEWFPKNMPPESQSQFLRYVTDCVISIVEH